MIYYKLKDGRISQILETEDKELAKANDYIPCEKEIVQVYNGSYKFADEVTDADFLPSLDEVKANKISELKSIRDTKEVDPVRTDKGIFDYDDKSRDRLYIARQALTDNGGGEIVWTTADNQRVSMGIADFAAINGAAAVRSNALHIKYNELKQRVNACESVEEVNAIVWPED